MHLKLDRRRRYLKKNNENYWLRVSASKLLGDESGNTKELS